MTRIAYILKMYPRFSETFIVNEILELERQGVDVRIYSLRKPDDGRFHASLARVKANVVYVPQYPQMELERVRAAHEFLATARPAAYADGRAYAETLQQPYGLKRFLQAGFIAAHLLKHPVDALHAHFASSAARVANLVTRLTRIPYSFTAHAKDIFHEEVNPISLQRKISEARFVVTVSQFNRAYLQQLLGDAPGDVRCLYNGIDLHQFCPDPRIEREPGLILGVGRLVEKKGFDLLIDACAILQQRGLNFRCEIVGSGEQRDALAQQIMASGLANKVFLVGPRTQEDVRVAYQRATIFALPCRIGQDGNRDGLPTVLLEAMACGLPVVTTPVTGNPEIVDDGLTGRLVAEEDAMALANALAELLQDEAQRRQMGLAAREKTEQAFDVRRNVTQLRQWLAEPAAVPDVTSFPAAATSGYETPIRGERLWTPQALQPIQLLPEMPVVPQLEEVLA
ncbi:MAG: glycosyltransferase family 4 protein [Candidatus Promineifilaceae bacterium]